MQTDEMDHVIDGYQATQGRTQKITDYPSW